MSKDRIFKVNSADNKVWKRTRTLLTVFVVIALMAASFYGGFILEHRDFDDRNIQDSFYAQPPKNLIIGHVVAVSQTKLSVKDENSGQTRTYSIDSSTIVRHYRQDLKLANIKVGEMVIVHSRGNQSVKAILINPDLKRFPGVQ